MTFAILVVENPNDQWALDALARRAGPGVAVQSFTKPSYALAWLEENRAALILAGYRMPDMRCETFVSLCRDVPGRANIPIVVATATEDAAIRPPRPDPMDRGSGPAFAATISPIARARGAD